MYDINEYRYTIGWMDGSSTGVTYSSVDRAPALSWYPFKLMHEGHGWMDGPPRSEAVVSCQHDTRQTTVKHNETDSVDRVDQQQDATAFVPLLLLLQHEKRKLLTTYYNELLRLHYCC